MSRIGLIATTARYRQTNDLMAIRDFYQTSPLFRYSLKYCESTYDQVFVLTMSCRRILVPDEDMKDVDFRLNGMKKWQKKIWLREVSNDLRTYLQSDDEIYFHASRWYRGLSKWIEPDFTCHFPLQGKAIGQQLKFYKDQVGNLPLEEIMKGNI